LSAAIYRVRGILVPEEMPSLAIGAWKEVEEQQAFLLSAAVGMYFPFCGHPRITYYVSEKDQSDGATTFTIASPTRA